MLDVYIMYALNNRDETYCSCLMQITICICKMIILCCVPLVLLFVELVQNLFMIPGVTLFLGNRVCQHPLANFFQRGRVNKNPSANENTQALRVIHITCKEMKGNC